MKQVSEVIWQEAASLYCHPRCGECIHPPCAHSTAVGMLQFAGTYSCLKSAATFGGIWTHLVHSSWTHKSAPQMASRWVQPFCTAHPCTQHTQTDTQTTLHVTSVGIGHIYALHAGDVALKHKKTLIHVSSV